MSLIESLLARFRAVISEDEARYGFTLSEFEAVASDFPDVDLLDENPRGCDHAFLVLNNIFAFTLVDKPAKVLTPEEAI